MSKVVHPKNDEEAQKAIESGKVVLKFGAEWCPPCKKIAPILESMADKQNEWTYVAVDVD